MRRVLRISLPILFLLAAACAALTVGREFPSPSADMIRIGQTSKADLLRVFGEPTEVGLDDGDQAWTWLHGQFSPERRKQLTVRFNDRGAVKSYTFNSNFPDDMKRLK